MTHFEKLLFCTRGDLYILCKGPDSMLKFVVTLTFPSQIANPLVSADPRGRSAHDVAQTEGDA